MLCIGLTGGIGAGKSTVSCELARLGAVVVDADLIAREVVAAGTPGLHEITAHFGEQVLSTDGSLNRPALGAIVFGDATARRELEAITHPLIQRRTRELFEQAPPEAVLVHDVPLLVELGMGAAYHLVVIVDASEEARLARLMDNRGMTQAEARARIDAQASHAQREAAADVWLHNHGSTDDLQAQVDALWRDRLAAYNSNLLDGRCVRRVQQVQIVQPRDEWAAQGERAVARIRHQLAQAGVGGQVRSVEHIGSTSVPGLPAKDVIDLQVEVDDLALAQTAEFKKAMLAAGFVYDGERHDDPQAWAPDPSQWSKVFYGGCDPAVVHHVHVRGSGTPGAVIAPMFRDWLRAHPAEGDDYAAMKFAVAERFPGGEPVGSDYSAAKSPWLASAFERAREWHAGAAGSSDNGSA
ncbi:dephospho-CoA kinase [Rudaeicoccus suwonensis]|uniref:Dephospho-CoA kinase n=1 Tax=Rudaeicoccus suwonensis TaxID=657409 RepID=A0A561EAL5_9MICO|nr:dephospho-CoA kinase [Rudaeicoccus suwonensis]TWE12646.1 dephospho-CoA kinase [Rudaeicoccus suwonensis]